MANDGIKAIASGAYKPVDTNYKDSSYLTTPVTLNRLPGEKDSAYLYRLTAIKQRQEQAKQRQEAFLQYRNDYKKRQEQQQQELKDNNTKYLNARYSAILDAYRSNDIKAIEEAISKYNSLIIDDMFMETGGAFSTGNVRNSRHLAEIQLENLKNGGENSSHVTRPDQVGKNVAGFDFKPQFQQDMLG